jgi:hypothetical protein
MQQQQSQYQGPERRQSQTQYQGDDRRRPDPVFDETTIRPGDPGMSMQERKEEQAERVRQQEEKHHDRH